MWREGGGVGGGAAPSACQQNLPRAIPVPPCWEDGNFLSEKSKEGFSLPLEHERTFHRMSGYSGLERHSLPMAMCSSHPSQRIPKFVLQRTARVDNSHLLLDFLRKGLGDFAFLCSGRGLFPPGSEFRCEQIRACLGKGGGGRCLLDFPRQDFHSILKAFQTS